MDLNKKAIRLHKKLNGKISIIPKITIKNRKDLSLIYTPGVAAISQLIKKDKSQVYNHTIKKNSVAVVSDGSAVLGLGNIGPEAALPVMEGKCLLFKHFANIDAYPIVLSTQDPQEIVKIVAAIAPGFGGINLEDIAAPHCFFIEEELKKNLDIPVIHDDQWGAAVATLAALINALKLVDKSFPSVKIVISGAGAAGSAITKLLYEKESRNILVCDRQGIIYKSRPGNSTPKEKLALITNPNNEKGKLETAMKNADVFVGVSSPNLVTKTMIESMNDKAIVLALANPIPEIMPNEAKKAGAFIVGSGRSDFANQVNNSLVFPGVFRGALNNKIKKITMKMLIQAAENLADLVKKPTPEKIIPTVFDKNVVNKVSQAIK